MKSEANIECLFSLPFIVDGSPLYFGGCLNTHLQQTTMGEWERRHSSPTLRGAPLIAKKKNPAATGLANNKACEST